MLKVFGTSSGGARCEGCPFDAESIDAWDITEFEWKDEEITTWNDGWVTLYKNADDPSRYDLSYVNEDRTESGLITNSYCVRDGSTELSCTGPALGNSIVKKIFACYTSITSLQNP